MKNLVKATGKANSLHFQYLAEKFPNISAAKLKQGIFVSAQIKSVLQNEGFNKALNSRV